MTFSDVTPFGDGGLARFLFTRADLTPEGRRKRARRSR
jgi:hypothetical protein